MYDVALSVLSCVRAHTEVHVAWIVDPPTNAGADAVAFTPGGGRMGELLTGALDHALRDAIPGLGAGGGLVEVTIGPAEALMSGVAEGTSITVAIAAGPSIPESVLADLVERRPVSFDLDLDGQSVSCSFNPVPRAVMSGSGEIADALLAIFTQAGWRASVAGALDTAVGLMTTLAPIDVAIVMGHDVETSARALQAAIESDAGYIGSVGSRRMQELRKEWLSYRGVDWPERVHGPAGIPINSSNPGEIAVSIAAEAIASVRATGSQQR